MPPDDKQFKTIAAITLKLAQLGLEVTFVDPITVGPLITTYRFAPKNAAKISQITSLADDLALALAVESVTVRRLPGEGVIGVSVPNLTRTVPLWRDHLKPDHITNQMHVPLALGVTSQGQTFREDLSALPHLLIAGSTGGGKTVESRSIIASLMFWRSPERVQFVLSDTKQVEFGLFDNDPHMWRPRTTSVYQTLEYMDDLITEMESRLKLIAARKLHNIHEHNQLFPTTQLLSYIVLVIDELADLLASGDKGVSKLAQQKLGTIVQKSRAAGVYVIAATQRPSVNIVSGSIKANFPARLSFRLPSEADSRTVLGHSGAEHLLSLGDMFYVSPLAPSSRRLHSCYASTEDITQCIAFAQQQMPASNKPVQNYKTQ
jgi:S-DNA-T family DNA segregation ATPase FtsK/SpoIIIE